jgi:hypothetical protein
MKSTIPNVARKAPLALDPPCSVVIASPYSCFRLHERGLVGPVWLASWLAVALVLPGNEIFDPAAGLQKAVQD